MECINRVTAFIEFTFCNNTVVALHSNDFLDNTCRLSLHSFILKLYFFSRSVIQRIKEQFERSVGLGSVLYSESE